MGTSHTPSAIGVDPRRMERWVLLRSSHAKIWFVFFASLVLFLLMSLFVDFSPLLNVKSNVSIPVSSYTNFKDSQNHVTVDPLHQDHSLLPQVENTTHPVTKQPVDGDKCSGRYIYVHDLPSRFNDDLIKDCHSLFKFSDWCPDMENSGLGHRIGDSNGVFSSENWYLTNQFLLEKIFHDKMKQYECLTRNSSQASAVFVPAYVGLDVGRYLWEKPSPKRDLLSLDLVRWLRERQEWKKMWGRDHFLVAGRVSWDFRRKPGDDWGSVLMQLPEAMNMTMLSIEGTSWNNDFAIPYPTYFHPTSDDQVLAWQKKVRKQRRRKLFAFVGAPRPGQEGSIRSEIIRQCQAAKGTCQLLNCKLENCHDPVRVMNTFMNSVFCLQPPGDSFTRRSAFDSILAGCIPVFFHPGSAYVQYLWHFRKNHTEYSVFIPEDGVKEGRVSIEETLLRMLKMDMMKMRENVISMIPRIIYANPNSKLVEEDAFGIAVKGVLDRVEGLRRDIREGKDCDSGFDNWGSKLNATAEADKWAPFFSS